jgi:Virulence-associated protein E/Bifunctional DNA primase/polymerase, N-terminal
MKSPKTQNPQRNQETEKLNLSTAQRRELLKPLEGLISTTSDPFSPERFGHWNKASCIAALVGSGRTLIRLVGESKSPMAEEWQLQAFDPAAKPEDFPHNYGVSVRDGLMVIDVDPRAFGDGDPLARIREVVGKPLDTFVVQTGGGGWHIYLDLPASYDPRKRYYTNLPRSMGWGGLEFKTRRSQVVGPFSVGPQTGEPYLILRGHPSQLATCPDQLLEVLENKTWRESLHGYDGRDDLASVTRFMQYLEHCPRAVENMMGDPTTFRVAAIGKDYGLSAQKTFELMRDHWNQYCTPPWHPIELEKKVSNAYSYSSNPSGSSHPGADFDNPEVLRTIDAAAAQIHARKQWSLNRKGELKPNDAWNTLMFFTMPPYKGDGDSGFKSDLYNILRYNQFSNRIEYNFTPPWASPDDDKNCWDSTEAIRAMYYMRDHALRYETKPEMLNAAAIEASYKHQYHPIRNWLAGLKWDGIRRLELLFSRYCGAENSFYTREVGRCFLIAAVARVMRPGCKYDNLLVLEGPQGIGKSTFIQKLGDQYYGDLTLDPHAASTVYVIQNKWFIELAEMEAQRRSDANALKAFLSRAEIRYRPLWEKSAVDYPLQCVFAGTINPKGTGYLTDSTGNRRFWPITCGNIDIAGLLDDRSQLFAEAYHRFQTGEPWHMTNPEAIRLAEIQQARRVTTDPWAMIIASYLQKECAANVFPHITPTQLAHCALGLSPAAAKRADLDRIADVLTSLGWERDYNRDGNLSARFRNPYYEDVNDL